jgi:DNA mismatch repair protein MutL
MMFLVNGRVIRDKQLIAAVRAGYRDVMFHDRYPVAVISIEMDPADVDVNVHPAKREVRFSAPQRVRSAVIAAIRAAMDRMGGHVSSTTTMQAMHSMQGGGAGIGHGVAGASSPRPTSGAGYGGMPRFSSGDFNAGAGYRSLPTEPASPDVQHMLFSASQAAEPRGEYHLADTLQLGQPLAQIHRCYILAQTEQGVILVDQHAAHERMTYEKLKRQLATDQVSAQQLLTPEVLHLQGETAAWLQDHFSDLERFGIQLEVKDDECFLIRSVPAMLIKESAA